MICLWYNPISSVYFVKFFITNSNYQVGIINAYGHILEIIIVYDHLKKSYVSVTDYYAFYKDYKSRYEILRKKKEKVYFILHFPKVLIIKVIDDTGRLLYRRLSKKYGNQMPSCPYDGRALYLKYRHRE